MDPARGTVSRSLRTQQCASVETFHRHAFHAPKDSTCIVLVGLGLMVNDLPLSFPHGTIVRGGLWMLLRAPDAP